MPLIKLDSTINDDASKQLNQVAHELLEIQHTLVAIRHRLALTHEGEYFDAFLMDCQVLDKFLYQGSDLITDLTNNLNTTSVIFDAGDLQHATLFDLSPTNEYTIATEITGITTGPTKSGKFSLGEPTKPEIYHDNGFTEFCENNPDHDDCSPSAGFGDYTNRAKYETLLRGAQGLGHLDDGTRTYSHYLYGDGEDLHFNYGEFINEDEHGKIAYNNIMREAQKNAEVIGEGRSTFSITSDVYSIGIQGPGADPRFPYPASENWQKAIGSHAVWTSADVQITTNEIGQKVYTMDVTYHAEDRYNFNPNMGDITTGLKDRENGRFEVLGWANPYMQYGDMTTTVTWVEGQIDNTTYSDGYTARSTDRGADRRGEINDR
jgi:hypothetical protein